jgi:primosomal protein N' (replication factor Y)
VLLDVPIDDVFDYLPPALEPDELVPGMRVIVPWGKTEKIGLLWGWADESTQALDKLKAIKHVLTDVPPLDAAWRHLIEWVARYYHKPLGEVALAVIPTSLRRAEAYRLTDGPRESDKPSKLKKSKTPNPALLALTNPGGLVSRSLKLLKQRQQTWLNSAHTFPEPLPPQLNAAQQAAAAAIAESLQTGFQRHLLHGVTGSGKTEVYLQAIAACRRLGKQALLLVPEINLTPQLETELQARFPQEKIALLHSARSQGERAIAWLSAQSGEAGLIVGTRLAVLTPLANLGLIVVDEEHDTSYKQQEGVRYSARDVAILRAQQLNIPVVLGSATPALETWLRAQTGDYQYLHLPERAVSAAQPPRIEMIDTRAAKLTHGLSERAERALAEALARGETSLVFMNRRGYAPVLHCGQCGWVSQCRHCSVYSVFHKADGRLHCHHCGWQAKVPAHCPSCGNVDVVPLGYGTQRVEDYLQTRFPSARIIRIDADSTTGKAGAAPLLAKVHAGEADILIGTQMVAKGHDFQRLSLVIALNSDSALFSQDFRAPERLFAQLLQVAGRAGRDGTASRMLIQSHYPEHNLYQALQRHDYQGFAEQQLQERRLAQLPPYRYQALLKAEAKVLADAMAFLEAARLALPEGNGLSVYDPVPLTVVRVAGSERAQLLLECDSRPYLQAILQDWVVYLQAQKSRVRWVLDVDPLEV